MRKYLTMALAGVLALGLGSAAFAVECALDVVPASTLLFPFVSYDYEQGAIDNSGQNTLIGITNVSSDAQIVHITVWTDFSIAILDFNLTLTGYDVQTISIRDILRDGILPSDDTLANEWWDGTVPSNAGNTPFDDGPYSSFNDLNGGALDGYFALFGLPDPDPTGTAQGILCDPAFWVSSPINYRAENNGNIPGGVLALFQGYLQTSQTKPTAYANCAWGSAIVFDNGTWFTNQEPRSTWMYITADVVAACNKDLPDGQAETYFSTSVLTAGVVTANVLMGDVLWVDAGNNFSEMDNAVHLEANPDITVPTFYQHLWEPLGIGGLADYREPLPTAWGFRYAMDDRTGSFTWIRAWRSSMENAVISDLGMDVDGNTIITQDPAALYSNTCVPYTYYAWDEDELANSFEGGVEPPWSGGPANEPIPVPNLFPLETQEVAIDQFNIVNPDGDGTAFGWMMVIWGGSNGYDEDTYQSWMGVKFAAGQYTAGRTALVLANYNCDDTQVLPGLGIGMYSTP